MSEPTRPRVSPLLLALALLVGILGLAWAVAIVTGDKASNDTASGTDSPFRGNRLPTELTTRAAPRIRLRDGNGLLVDSRELVGKPYLVTFLYTSCPDVCPLIGQQVKEGLRQLGYQARDVTALIVSVDPRGDTPQAVQTWTRRQRMPGNVRYLIGESAELQPVWADWYAAPQDPARPETSTHSAAVWLIDDQGRRRTKLDAGDGIEPADLAHDLRLLLNE